MRPPYDGAPWRNAPVLRNLSFVPNAPVDGNFSYWCCSDLKNFGTFAVAVKFQCNGSVNASGAMDGLFPVHTYWYEPTDTYDDTYYMV